VKHLHHGDGGVGVYVVTVIQLLRWGYRPASSKTKREVAMNKLLIPILFVCLSGFSAGAEQARSKTPPDSKPAWQWTDDERFAARFAPGSAKARLDTMMARSRRPALSRAGEPEPKFRDVVDGKTDPQLFFPLEVFQNLVEIVIRPGQPEPSAADKLSIDRLMAEVASSQLPVDFRVLLDRETAAYVEVVVHYRAEVAELVARRPRRGDKEIDDKLRALQGSASVQQCRAIHAAMAGMRRALGEEAFQTLLEFLYKAVAPRMAFLSQSDDASPDNRLRTYVGGCE
jgi:hypothetical protein